MLPAIAKAQDPRRKARVVRQSGINDLARADGVGGSTGLRVPRGFRVFLEGLRVIRDQLAPTEIHQQGPWFIVRERDPADRPPRREEWFGWDILPARAWTDVGGGVAPSDRPFLSLAGPGDPTAAKGKPPGMPEGYRLASTEFLMERVAAEGRTGRRDPRVARVRDPGEALRVAEANRGGLISLTELTARQPTVRLYAAWADARPVAWVRSVRTGRSESYVANLRTVPEFRRQGLATALLQRLLEDDRRRGIRRSVLVATRAGREVYLRLGYRDAGIIRVFSPVRSVRSAGPA